MVKKYMNFVITSDKNYVIPITVLMTSILKHTHKSYVPRFFLFTTGYTQTELDIVSEIKKHRTCEIVNMPMDQYLEYFKSVDTSTFTLQYISLATYYRLLLFKILPEDVDKCFYIDGDMIVGKDLSPIYKNLSPNKLAAVVVEIFAMAHKETLLKHLSNISDFFLFNENPYKAPYFNAGFLLINVKKAKELMIFEQCLDFLQRYPNPPYADQDTLNAILGQKYHNDIIYLDPSYNVFCDISYTDSYISPIYSKKQIKKAFKSPVIYHYAGGNKPWINRNVKHFYEVWHYYCHLSPVSKQITNKAPKSTNKKIYLFKYLLLFRIKYVENKTYIYLFGCVPFLKRKISQNSQYWYIFNCVKFLKITHKGNLG